jgi:hypothetical protein
LEIGIYFTLALAHWHCIVMPVLIFTEQHLAKNWGILTIIQQNFILLAKAHLISSGKKLFNRTDRRILR